MRWNNVIIGKTKNVKGDSQYPLHYTTAVGKLLDSLEKLPTKLRYVAIQSLILIVYNAHYNGIEVMDALFEDTKETQKALEAKNG